MSITALGINSAGDIPPRPDAGNVDSLRNDRRANVLGVAVNAYSMEEVLVIIRSAIERGTKGYICATGVHGVMEAQKDARLCGILNGSLINVPDGRPTVWVGRLQGLRGMKQVTGPNLMLRVCELSVTNGYTHFFYGGNVGVAEQLRDSLVRRFPGLNVVGTYTPPFRPLLGTEAAELSRLISQLKPDIFWVGLSTPKQEKFMAEYLHKMDTKLMFAVGAAFDIHTGKIRESPEWVKTIGMQWLHRLCQDPGRLWRRYLVNNPRFLASMFLQFTGLKKFRLTAPSSNARAVDSASSFS
jgi:N-acetylglucosaminyldiphosphoundecaprenol N-acetyl-beta-D-mannosaminyltransferase